MTSAQALKINCPSCKKDQTLRLEKQNLTCNDDNCSFKTSYSCPICKEELLDAYFLDDHKETSINCPSCKNKVPVKKISYLIENKLSIDYDKKCETCNAPSIYRKENPLNHRCFFFPQCSGQSELFADKKDALVFLDFETSGLEIGKDSIIEIGAVKIDTDGIEHYFQALVSPLSELSPKIESLTGITNELLAKEGRPLKESMTAFLAFAGNAKLIAHNSKFDIPWLITAILRHNLNSGFKDIICTLNWAKNNKERGCSLGALTKRYGIQHENAHRALADAIATKELYLIFENKKNTDAPIESFDSFRSTTEKVVNRYQDYFQP